MTDADIYLDLTDLDLAFKDELPDLHTEPVKWESHDVEVTALERRHK